MGKSRFTESLILPQQKEAVIQAYTESSKLPADSEKTKWGSEESMLNRFRLALDLVEWTPVLRWLDIGCGPGRFFALAEDEGHRFDELIGIDITETLIDLARQRTYASPARFVAGDLEAMPDDVADVDLVTLIGVLQLCGCPLETAVVTSIRRLRPGGQIFLTTKHLGWSAFDKQGFDPDPGHSWFLFDDVRRAVENAGAEVLDAGGFIPREGRSVALKDAHTLFIRGRRT